jgi:spermidine synthase
MLTNGYSMSATSLCGLRYMRLYVQLPVAIHADMKSALLIRYGVGTTAKALTDTRSFKRIDRVDISRDVFEMSRIVYPDPASHPFSDPRVPVAGLFPLAPSCLTMPILGRCARTQIL